MSAKFLRVAHKSAPFRSPMNAQIFPSDSRGREREIEEKKERKKERHPWRDLFIDVFFPPPKDTMGAVE